MLTKQTLLLSLLVLGLNNTCNEGCVRCGTDNTCLECDLRLGWVLSDGSCSRSVDTKCILNGAQGNCLLCNQNFFFDATQSRCVRSSRRLTQCIHQRDNSLCEVCAEGYYPLNGNCVAVATPIANCKYHQEAERCLKCDEGYWPTSDFSKCVNSPGESVIEGCALYSNLYCSECKNEYHPNANNYIYALFQQSSQESYERFMYNWQLARSANVVDAQCEPVKVSNCQVYKTAVECSQCVNGYYLAQGNCLRNPFTIIDNCLQYSASDKCSRCEAQYYISNNFTECKLATNQIEHCAQRNLSNCLACETGFYLQGNQCIQQLTIQNCLTYSATSATCVACNESYVLTTDSLKCLPQISNCKSYSVSSQNDDSLTCQSCTNNSYLDSNNSCSSGTVPNCLEYNNNGTQCFVCKNGYYLTGNQCVAHMNIPNCAVYSGSLKNTCTQCATNHFLFVLSKVCHAAQEILHCKSYSDKTTCNECDDGYFLDNLVCSEIPEEEHCLKRVLGQPDCAQCALGYFLNTQNTPNNCELYFEQQEQGCYQSDVVGHTDHYQCSVCKGAHYFVDLGSLSTQGSYEGNICGKIDRIPVSERVSDCVAYVYEQTRWQCQRCSDGYFLKDLSGNSLNFGDTCSNTCSDTVIVLDANYTRAASNSVVQIAAFSDFAVRKCKSQIAPLDQCEYLVPINKTTNATFTLKCGKKKNSSNLIQKLLYEPGNESAIGFAGSFDLPTKNGYAAPTYDLDATTINVSYPTSSTNCLSHNVNTNGNSNKYCNQCVLRYSGKAQVADAGNPTLSSYLNCDQQIADCETDVLGGFVHDFRAYKRHLVNPMHVACHVCSTSGQIPFIHLPLDANAKWTTRWYQPFKVEDQTAIPKDSPVKDGPVVQCRQPTAAGLSITPANFTRQFPANCAMGLYNVSISKTFKDSDALTAVSVYCLICKPGYKAVYNADGFLSNCDEIAYCDNVQDKSVNKFVNGCAQCSLGYNWNYDTTSKNIQFDECIAQTVDNCIASEAGNCKYCKKGYYLENSKTCNKLIVPKCVSYNFVDYAYNNIFDDNIGTNLIQTQTPFALYLSTLQKGCTQCSSGYFALYNYKIQHKQCVSAVNLIEKKYLNSTHLIENCGLYSGDTVKKCHRCNSLYIPNQDSTKCVLEEPFFRCTRVNEISSAQFECIECEPKYFLVNKKCTLGTIPNCKAYDANTVPLKCIECNEKYRVARDSKSCVLGNLPYCLSYLNTFETSCNTCQDQAHPLVSVNKTGVTLKRCFRDLPEYNCAAVDIASVDNSVYSCTTCLEGYYRADPSETLPENICVSTAPIPQCEEYDYTLNMRYPDGSHKCKKCAAGYYVSEYGFSCKVRSVNIENCAVYANQSLECVTCADGHFLSTDKMTCYLNPSGVKFCEDFSSATQCIRCQNEYYLNQNLCLPVAANLIIPGCTQYNESQLCVKCNSNYYFDSTSNTCNAPNAFGCETYTDINTCATCPEGRVFQEVQKAEVLVKNCIPYSISFCLKIDPITRFCLLCAQNYFPQEDGNCGQANLIPNCLYYETQTLCQRCLDGFYLTQDKKECFQNGFDGMNSMSSCAHVVYKEQQQCVACEEGKYFSEGKCVSCQVENCLACDPREPTKCLLCQSDYTQKSPFGKCDVNLVETIVLSEGDEDNKTLMFSQALITLLVILFN